MCAQTGEWMVLSDVVFLSICLIFDEGDHSGHYLSAEAGSYVVVEWSLGLTAGLVLCSIILYRQQKWSQYRPILLHRKCQSVLDIYYWLIDNNFSFFLPLYFFSLVVLQKVKKGSKSKLVSPKSMRSVDTPTTTESQVTTIERPTEDSIAKKSVFLHFLFLFVFIPVSGLRSNYITFVNFLKILNLAIRWSMIRWSRDQHW